MDDLQGLDTILQPMPPAIRALTREVVTLIAGHPQLSGKVMAGWRSVNFSHAKAGYVCAVLAQTERVSIFFQHGSLLSDPDGLLVGEPGKKGRILRLAPGQAVPDKEIGLFLMEAIALFT